MGFPLDYIERKLKRWCASQVGLKRRVETHGRRPRVQLLARLAQTLAAAYDRRG